MEIGKIYHGFKLIDDKYIKELNSSSKLLYHEKSGAKLFFLQNDDDNKVFSIAFRTTPSDSTGVPHILEHSVLCGSRKFPVKEPFVELIKGSLNTFLNAMTFPDKTIYPVASKNDKDFSNLMDVYMDAVLYPNIYKYPEILMQEGWHYELDNKSDDLTYKGVVYNEMQGSFSSPESVLFSKIIESLFPNTTYGVESGGDPEHIPELTGEQFLNFHKKFYHPSNSYIFLYGNLDLMEKLEFLDTNYLKDFDKINPDSKIDLEKNFKQEKEFNFKYPISPDEIEDDKTYLSLNFVVGTATDAELALAFNILEYLLLETPASPLKKALIDANLGKDVFGTFETDILQPTFSIIVKNSNPKQKDKFKKVVFDTLRNLVKSGIDKKLIESSINIKEFQLREADFRGYTKGLIYNLKCLNSWLYDEDPHRHLEYDKLFENIKSSLTTNYFEKLIEKYLISNNHRSIVIIEPEKGLAEKKAEEIKQNLKKFKNGLSDKELDALVEQTKKLKLRQNTPDSPEDLKCIPLLSIDDINKETEKIPTVAKENKTVTILHHPIFTSGIGYLNMYFDSSIVPENNLNYLSLLSNILGMVSTTNYSYADLSNEINIQTGGIHFNAESFSEYGSDETYYPKFTIKSKALLGKTKNMFEIINEILINSKYDDKKRLKELISELRSRLEMSITHNGHMVALRRVTSYYSPAGKYLENLQGLSFYYFIEDLDNNFDSKADEITNSLNKVAKLVFNKNNLIVSFTSDENSYSVFEQNFSTLIKGLDTQANNSIKYSFSSYPKNEGLTTSGKIQYVAKGYNFSRLGYKYTGSLQVLKTIVGFDYLWNKVRVQGGAYGCFAGFQRSGNIYFCSYRDPNLTETLNVYDNMYKYVSSFDVTDREMTKYIIGTISNVDTPLTPSMKSERSDIYYINHTNYEDIQKERTEILNTDKNSIRTLADLIQASMKENYVCVLGSEDKIKQDKNIFNTIIPVFK